MSKATHSFISVARGEALKKLETFISDNHKDLQPMQALRARTDAAIATATVAIASFLIQSPEITALWPRLGILLLGYGMFEAAEFKFGRDEQAKKNLIRAADGMMNYIHESREERVQMPLDLPQFLKDVVRENKMPVSAPVNGAKKLIRTGFYGLIGAASLYAAAHTDFSKVVQSIQSTISQPALPANERRTIIRDRKLAA